MKLNAGLVVIALLSLGAGGAGDAKKDLDKLNGTWSVSELTYDGKVQNLKFNFVFKGGEGVVEGNDRVKNEYARVRFKLDPDAKPNAVDITIIGGSQTDATMKGIYEIKGNELRLCAKVFGTDRPTEFAAPEGSSIVLLTLTREK